MSYFPSLNRYKNKEGGVSVANKKTFECIHKINSDM